MLRVSYLEIYNENIIDLLASDKNTQEQQPLKIHESVTRGVFVAGLKEEIVSSADQVDTEEEMMLLAINTFFLFIFLLFLFHQQNQLHSLKILYLFYPQKSTLYFQFNFFFKFKLKLLNHFLCF